MLPPASYFSDELGPLFLPKPTTVTDQKIVISTHNLVRTRQISIDDLAAANYNKTKYSA